MNDRRLDDFEIDNVRESGNRELIDGAFELWLAERALPRAEAERRLDQLLLVASERDSGRVAGMVTTYLETKPRLRVPLWTLRAYVAADFRQRDIGFHMLFAALDYHQDRFTSGQDRSGRGLYMEIENPVIQRARNEAVWQRSRFVFIGVNPRGDHCRVRYFDGARID